MKFCRFKGAAGWLKPTADDLASPGDLVGNPLMVALEVKI